MATIPTVYRDAAGNTIQLTTGKDLIGWPRAVSLAAFPKEKALPPGVSSDKLAQTAASFAPRKTTKTSGKPSPNDNLYFWTNVQVEVTLQLIGKDPQERCWVLASEIGNTDLQRHEQGHLDLVGIVARDFCCELMSLRESDELQLHAEASQKQQRYNKLLHLLDEIYEQHTKNGTSANAQAMWDGAIQSCITYGSNAAVLLYCAQLAAPGLVRSVSEAQGLV